MAEWIKYLTDSERAQLANLDDEIDTLRSLRRQLMNRAKQRKHRAKQCPPA